MPGAVGLETCREKSLVGVDEAVENEALRFAQDDNLILVRSVVEFFSERPRRNKNKAESGKEKLEQGNEIWRQSD